METTTEPFWDLLGRAFGLEAEVFRQISILPNGLILALSCVLAAGLSLAFGQSIILFVNRVTPIRFFFSLVISAVLYVFGFLFLVFSTWLICQVPWSVEISLVTLVKVFGLSYAPLLFSFLGALPYFGVPLLRILSIWHLLAMVVGFAAIAGTGLGSAFGYV
ncbi:MAG: CAAX protease, partial [Hydrococcus sp. Prado102]|nr:CAAX protease [Hydrococcus sp. Prado102]